jgi:hypothetical protein
VITSQSGLRFGQHAHNGGAAAATARGLGLATVAAAGQTIMIEAGSVAGLCSSTLS